MNHVASFGVALRREVKVKRKKSEIVVEDDLPAVHKAAAYGNIDQLVVEVQGDPSLLELQSPEGLTPLGQAVLCQQLETVKRLIKMGANIDVQDNVGRTCLSIAAYQGWHDGVMCLLRNGAKQNICDKSGRYPLHAATYHSDISTITLLLNGLSSKDINLPDHELMTAVHWAAFHDRPEHLMLLVQKGGDVLAKDIDGKLPLHWAAQNCCFQCVHRLTSMSEGLATVNEKDYSGKSPVHYAAAAGSANILKILARCENIDLEVEDPDERTPLHWASAMGHAEAVDTLLRLGVNPYPTDVDGCTPLDYALQTNNTECVKVMEIHLGTRSVKKYKQRYMASRQGELSSSKMDKDLRYHYSRGQTPESDSSDTESGPNKNAQEYVPSIRVQAPTTTVTKTTTSQPRSHGPRMYSASTDTDVCDLNLPSVRSTKDVSYNEPLTSRVSKEEIQHGSVFAQLIGCSFMAGAQAPILGTPNQDVSKFRDGHPETSDMSKAEQDKVDNTEWEDTSKWAAAMQTNLPSSQPSTERSDLKVMTSTNTPDINRVSVQSFRSIPPIVGSGGQHRDSSGRGKSNHVNSLPLKGAKLTPLPSIPVKENNAELSPRIETPRRRGSGKQTPGKLAPIPQLPLRIRAEDVSPPTTSRPEPLPLDFMTENHAETRILARKWRDSLNKLHERSEAANYISLPSSRDKSNKAAAKVSANKGTSSHEKTASGFVKHSRILSTHQVKMISSDSDNVSQQPLTLQLPDKGHKSTSTFCSVDMNSARDKYLQDDHAQLPMSPTPLGETLASYAVSKSQKVRGTNPHQQAKRAKPIPNAVKSHGTQKGLQGSKNTNHLAAVELNKGNNSSIPRNNPVTVHSILNTNKQYKGLTRPKHEKRVQIAHQIAHM